MEGQVIKTGNTQRDHFCTPMKAAGSTHGLGSRQEDHPESLRKSPSRKYYKMPSDRLFTSALVKSSSLAKSPLFKSCKVRTPEMEIRLLSFSGI
jgi:hypothetical protein